jgi:RNA polymerase sigma factor (sigma-70 family)
MNDESAARLVHQLQWAVSRRGLAHVADKELLQRFVRERDELAFEALLRRHAPLVWGVCRRHLRQQHDAEDALQATFLVFVRRAATIKRGELLGNWLFGVARRVARNIEREKLRFRKRVFLCENLMDLPATGESDADDIAPLIDDGLAVLPRKFRLPLLLCSLQGMTHAEAGRHLGWPTGTVASRLSRGRQLLRKRLARHGVTVSIGSLTAVLAHQAASAAVPPLLVISVLRLVSFTSPPGMVSFTALALAQNALRRVVWSRLLLTACTTVAVAGMLGGAAAFWNRSRTGDESIAEQTPTIRMPSNPDAVVLQLERAFGQGEIGARLRIHGDGRLVAEVPAGVSSLAPGKITASEREPAKSSGGAPVRPTKVVVHGKLSPETLNELMEFVVRDQEFFDFDKSRVEDALQMEPSPTGRRRFSREDATTTLIHLQTGDRQHRVSWERLYDVTWKYPQVKRLAQLYAIDMRLQQEFHIVLAGGIESVENVVQRMNQHTQELFVNAPRLSVKDLKSFVPATGANPARYSFFRMQPLADIPDFWVSIEFPAEGEPRYGFTYPPDGPIRPRQPVFLPCMAHPSEIATGGDI